MSLEFEGTLVPYSSELGVVSNETTVSTCSPVFIAEIKRLHKYSSLIEVKVTHNGDLSTGKQTLLSIKPFFTNTIDSSNPPIRDADLAFYDEQDEDSLTYVKKYPEVRLKASSLPCTFNPGETKSFYPKIDKYPDGTLNLDFIGFELSSECQVFRITPKPHLGIRVKAFQLPFAARAIFDKLRFGNLFLRSFNMFYYGLENIIENKYPIIANTVIKEEIPITTRFVYVLNEFVQGDIELDPNVPIMTFPFQFPEGEQWAIHFRFQPVTPLNFNYYPEIEDESIDKFSVLIRVGYSYTASGNIIYEDFYL